MEKKVQVTKIVKHTEFQFLKWESVQNVTMALVQAGYFVRVIHVSSAYLVEVYKYKQT